jgi:hypothetical protein
LLTQRFQSLADVTIGAHENRHVTKLLQLLESASRPFTTLAKELGRDEVHKTLAPPGLLDDEPPPSTFDNVLDCLLLIRAEARFVLLTTNAKKFEGTLSAICHQLDDDRRSRERARRSIVFLIENESMLRWQIARSHESNSVLLRVRA